MIALSKDGFDDLLFYVDENGNNGSITNTANNLSI